MKPSVTALGSLFLATAWVAAPASAQPAAPSPVEAPLPSREVEALLQTKPTTAPECFEAATILAKLERPELAKQFLARVLAMKLDQEQLAELADRFGSPAFLGLAARPELNPEAERLAGAVLDAAREARQDSGRIEQLISQLSAASLADRNQAMLGLLEAGGAAIGPMVRVLADPRRKAEHAAVRGALVAMEGTAVGPLLGLLEEGNPELMAQAIRILAAMKADRAVPHLLGLACALKFDPSLRALAQAAVERITGRRPTPDDAARMLRRRAGEYFHQKQPVFGEVEGRVEWWHWDPERRSLVPRVYSEDEARRRFAARLARDAYAIRPDDRAAQLLYLTTLLEQAAFDHGLGNRLPMGEGTVAAQVLAAGPGAVEEVMQEAMATGHPAAAAAAAYLLSQAANLPDAEPKAGPQHEPIPDPAYEAPAREPEAEAAPEPPGGPNLAELLIHQGPAASPLVRAAIHTDRRVRMAALESLVALRPTRLFAGSHYVPQSLSFAASTGGKPKALLAGPKRDEMLQLAGWLAARGMGVDTVTNGREMLRVAAASPDYVVALVDSRLDSPTIDIALQKLRYEYRSADLRVGVLARADEFKRAEHMVRKDRMALWFAWPHDEATFDWQLDNLLAIDSEYLVPPEERQKMASRAMDLLLEISRPEQEVFDIRSLDDVAIHALSVPALAQRATVLTGRLGTPAAQTSLVDLASRDTAPLPLRRAAVTALGHSIENHGILLTTAEIRRQYDRYNTSGMRDPATQRVLAQILDYIEAPTQETTEND